MKNNKYTIWFEDGTGLEQYAQSMSQAVILACAKRINDAKNHGIDSIEDEKGKEYEISQQMEFSEIKLIQS